MMVPADWEGEWERPHLCKNRFAGVLIRFASAQRLANNPSLSFADSAGLRLASSWSVEGDQGVWGECLHLSLSHIR